MATQPAKANQVINAAKAEGVTTKQVKSFQSALDETNIEPFLELFNWSSGLISASLKIIDGLQATALPFLALIDKESAAGVAAFLQRVEDFIIKQQTSRARK